MAGLDTRTGRRNVSTPSKYVPPVAAKPAGQSGYASVATRLNRFEFGQPSGQSGQAQSRSPFGTQQVQRQETPRASDVWGTSNAAGGQSENFMQSYLNFANLMGQQNASQMKNVGGFSAGLQQAAANNTSRNTIAEGAAAAGQLRQTAQAARNMSAFDRISEINQANMAADRQAGQMNADRNALAYQQAQQRQLDGNNATKQYAGIVAQSDAQLAAAEAAARANMYGASQSAQAGMVSSLFGSLNSQQGWRYW